MKPSKEQIEAYRAMAKESSGADMKAQIQENLSMTCDKFAGNEDKLDRCIRYLTDCAREILDNKNGDVPDEVCFRICRDYYDDEIWKKEDEEAAKEKAEQEKRAEEIRKKDEERRKKAEAKHKNELAKKAMKESDMFKDNNNKPSTPEPYEYEEKDDDDEDVGNETSETVISADPVKPAEPVKPKPAQLDMFAMFGGK